jgi:translation initiation factor 2B subunit (eIF-2B alpha/beta/delta family)
MGGTHKSGHAATVAEAGRKAELARDYYEDTKAKELKELDKKEVKLLDELRKSLKTTDSIPNRTSMLMKRIRRGKEDKEEDNGGKEGVVRTKPKGRDRDDDREKEEKETMNLRDEKTKTKTYVSKADRKRLKKRRREEQKEQHQNHTTHARKRIE